jgi:hypothetical protein
MKKKEHDPTEWLDQEAVEGLIIHSAKMKSGKAGTKKGKKTGSSMGGVAGDDFEFDPFHPQNNLVVNGGPIPFSRNHKLKKKKVHEEAKVLVEESMGTFGMEEDKNDVMDYGDGAERPKKVKEMSDKRKRAALIKGNTNPASELRQQLNYKAQLDTYKKNRGIETVEQVDHSKLAQ